MEHLLLQLFARAIARRIEAGSRLGALLGCIIGSGAAVVLWLDFKNFELWLPILAGFIVLLGITGAIAGSYLPIGNKISEEVSATATIRLSDFNRCLPPVVLVAAMLLGMSVTIICMVMTKDTRLAAVLIFPLAFCVLMAALFLRSALRALLWIDLGANIAIRQLLRRQIYEPSAIRKWAITPVNNVVALAILLEGNHRLIVAIPPRRIASVTTRMFELAPRALQETRK